MKKHEITCDLCGVTVAEKDKEIARLKGNWDYLKEYLVALRNSRLHDENLLSSEMNRHNILFLNQLIEKINAADNNVGSITEINGKERE